MFCLEEYHIWVDVLKDDTSNMSFMEKWLHSDDNFSWMGNEECSSYKQNWCIVVCRFHQDANSFHCESGKHTSINNLTGYVLVD